MKKIALLGLCGILAGFSWVSQAHAYTVFCVNCSEMFTQAMDRVTNMEQLKNLIGSYQESIRQTQEQIALVQNNIQQYQNMIQNTLNLPANIIGEVKGQLVPLAQLVNQVNTLKGDVLAMTQIFDDLYPDSNALKNLVGSGNYNSEEFWRKWTAESDRAARATFQVSGTQLKDLAENTDALDRHISDLLSTPEGQMQALQSGNALASIQVNELRQLRTLIATDIQAGIAVQQEGAKKAQADKAVMDKFFQWNDTSD